MLQRLAAAHTRFHGLRSRRKARSSNNERGPIGRAIKVNSPEKCAGTSLRRTLRQGRAMRRRNGRFIHQKYPRLLHQRERLPVCEVIEELKKLDAVQFGGNKR
jgi:hypothetical protein